MRKIKNKPLVTIITIVKNAENTIENTIKSVLQQTYKNIEYIVIDGLSSDATNLKIYKYINKINYYLSEPDCGPADASNKGLSKANGDFIFFLNADDWIDENFIDLGVKEINESKFDFVYGNMNIYSKDKYICTFKGEKNYENKIKFTMPRLNYPSIIFSKKLFQDVGHFNINYKLSPDYELLLRAFQSGKRGFYSSLLYVNFRDAGLSNNNEKAAILEVRTIAIKSGSVKYICNIYYYRSYIKILIREFFKLNGLSNLYTILKKIKNK